MATRFAGHDKPKAVRKAKNVSLDVTLVAMAKELGLNVSRGCEAGLAAAIAEERRKRWLEENQDSIDASNAWVADHGLPLEKYRLA